MRASGDFAVKDYGAKGDGVTDDTAAVQAAMDAASKSGGRACLPPGKYLIKGSLNVSFGVHVTGAANSPQHVTPLTGTVVLATGGRDDENAPPLFSMGSSCSVSGLTVFYPDQNVRDIRPYPWTFHLQGGDNTVQNVTLINSYNGVKVHSKQYTWRHRIRSVYGCVLHRGVYVDNCWDIGSINDVHFVCHWWAQKEVNGNWHLVYEYMWKNLEAFTFGKTDWEDVTKSFVFPAKVGYRFILTGKGAMNGQLSGVGADACQRCMVIETIQPVGLLITNGQFVAFEGENPVQVEIVPTCRGSVRFVNCSFWGAADQNVVSHSRSFVSLSDCVLGFTFGETKRKHPDRPMIEADNGRLQVRGCSSTSPGPGIALRKGLKHAIVSDNNGVAGVQILNEIGDLAILRDNEPAQ